MSAPAQPAAPAAAAPQKPWQAKLVLLGEAAVGKSSVVLRFVSDEYVENKEPTIGAAFLTVSRGTGSVIGGGMERRCWRAEVYALLCSAVTAGSGVRCVVWSAADAIACAIACRAVRSGR
jgi:hypothetical protein